MERMGEAVRAALDNARATKRRRETMLVVNKVVLLSWQYLAAKHLRCHGVVGGDERFSTSHTIFIATEQILVGWS